MACPNTDEALPSYVLHYYVHMYIMCVCLLAVLYSVYLDVYICTTKVFIGKLPTKGGIDVGDYRVG